MFRKSESVPYRHLADSWTLRRYCWIGKLFASRTKRKSDETECRGSTAILGESAVTATVLSALLTAGVLGVTHAVEPDHVAGISSLTSQYGDSRLSALVGACFSLGHVALVVAWLVGGYLLLGRTEFPAVFDTVGTVGVVVLLSVLGAVMTVTGLRSLRRAHARDHANAGEEQAHLHLFGSQFLRSHDSTAEATEGVVPHNHGHSVGTYLKTGVLGALFTLSPPVSMIVFASSLFPDYGPGVVALAVCAYAAAITATMSAIGAGVGTAFSSAAERPRLYGIARALGGVLVAGLALSMLPEAVPGLL